MQALACSSSCHPGEGRDLPAIKEQDSGLRRNDDVSNGRDNFLSVELQEREAAHMPPFSRLAGIIVSGRDEKQVIEIARALGKTAPHGQGIQTFGPAPAPLAKLRGKYRHRLLVRADKNINLQRAVEDWTGALKLPAAVRVQIDIDPQSFL